jgi:hypothetical protein
MAFRKTLPVRLMVCPVLCAFVNAGYRKEALATVGCEEWKRAVSLEEGLMKETCLITMIRFPPTVWVILSVPGVPDQDILDMRSRADRNTVI